MTRLCLRIAVGLLTFVCGLTTSYWLDSQPSQLAQTHLEQETTVSLDGLWLMGNASGGNEAGTIIRIVQTGPKVQGIIEQPSAGYGKRSGVKKGDIEFEGTLADNRLRGQVHSYYSLETQKSCPNGARFILKHFEMPVTENGNLLAGWADNSVIDSAGCTMRIEGRTTYTFRRIK